MLPLLLPITLIFPLFSTHSTFVLFYINAVTNLADFLKNISYFSFLFPFSYLQAKKNIGGKITEDFHMVYLSFFIHSTHTEY